MKTRWQGMVVAGAGVALAVVAVSFDRFLGPAGGAMIIFAIAMQFVALALLARDRRETAKATAGASTTPAKRRPF